jgi:dienelactone hydrolase
VIRFAAALVCLCAFAQDPVSSARRALDLLLSERFADLSAMAAPSARQTFTPQFLHDRAGSEVKGFGKAGSIGAPEVAKDGRATMVTFPVEFARTTVYVQFTMNEAGQVAGIFFRPPWHHPFYSKPDSFHARDVTVGDDQWKLGGTLLVPVGRGKFPAVVLVHGPGPNDRDETIFSNKPFADLAEGLASRGIAVLRYDKRTKIYGTEMSGTAYTVQQETVEDAVRAVALLRRQPEIDASRIFVLGHSLGGYLAPRIAAQDGKLAGLIFLAANARPVETMALEQNEYVAGRRLDAMRAEVMRVRDLQPGKKNPPVLLGLPAAYLLDLKTYDGPAAARQLRLPMLFLQGGRDFQTTAKDFTLWKSALSGRPDVTFREWPELNHLMMEGRGSPSPAEYRIPGNVSPEVVNAIQEWISPPRRRDAEKNQTQSGGRK